MADKDRLQSKGQSIQPQRSHPNRKRLSARQEGLEADQRVNGDQDIEGIPRDLFCHRDVVLTEDKNPK